MDIALKNILADEEAAAASAEQRQQSRVNFSRIPVPGITPEMIRERETAHLKGQERIDAAASQAPIGAPAVPHITREMAVAAAKAYAVQPEELVDEPTTEHASAPSTESKGD